ncbi:lipid A biosynthesis lauroyl acyltransferase [Campylobacter fetus]|uniref:lipid A biosynthesis lauroyl acyltransferase n=1 Tax=Campylobacter fetus TaxID=196 RepID=UPI00073A83AD|nr:lipid A biosynthesis lauroyl acyltransferase [Campylobacter fetus]ALV65379.1 lipid A biosynthesis lauroyl acyltransferase [Campylobacter fetus subsp. testudinum Sp3]EAK0829428.1 lipid A biosynthesis acyltransferase [Campylobacter fetus]
MSDMIYLFLYKFFKFIVTYTPQSLQSPFFTALAYIFYKFDKKHTNIMRVNLKMCFPEFTEQKIEKIIKATYRNFGYFGADFLRNQDSTKENILNKVSFKNENILLNALATKRPIIVQTAHYGNWELFSLAMAAKFGSVSIVGRNLDSSVMDQILSKNRTKFDIELIPKDGGARDILKALKNRRILGILVDQNTAKKDGVQCEFFGKKIMHTPAASIFASKTGAIIIPAFIKRISRDKNEICFFKEILVENYEGDKLQKATQAQSDATKQMIKDKPDEYFWMHKKFKHFYEEIYK